MFLGKYISYCTLSHAITITYFILLFILVIKRRRCTLASTRQDRSSGINYINHVYYIRHNEILFSFYQSVTIQVLRLMGIFFYEKIFFCGIYLSNSVIFASIAFRIFKFVND